VGMIVSSMIACVSVTVISLSGLTTRILFAIAAFFMTLSTVLPVWYAMTVATTTLVIAGSVRLRRAAVPSASSALFVLLIVLDSALAVSILRSVCANSAR
jgi:hypothetical protein